MAFSPAIVSGLSSVGAVAKELAPVAVAVTGSAFAVKWLTPKPTFAEKVSEKADDATKYIGLLSAALALWDRMYPRKVEAVAAVPQMSQAEVEARIQKGVEEKFAAEKAAIEKALADERRLQEGIAAGIAQYVATQQAATPTTATYIDPSVTARKAKMTRASTR